MKAARLELSDNLLKMPCMRHTSYLLGADSTHLGQKFPASYGSPLLCWVVPFSPKLCVAFRSMTLFIKLRSCRISTYIQLQGSPFSAVAD